MVPIKKKKRNKQNNKNKNDSKNNNNNNNKRQIEEIFRLVKNIPIARLYIAFFFPDFHQQ